MSLFDSLIKKTEDNYVVTYMPNVKNKNERFRTSGELREFLKERKFIKSRIFVEDNNLYVIYTSLRKAGFKITSTQYLKIAPYEKLFKRQLELFNNTLNFQVAELTDDYIILKVPLRTICSDGTEQRGPKPSVIFTDEKKQDLRYRYHLGKIPATQLAKEVGVKPAVIYNIVGKYY